MKGSYPNSFFVLLAAFGLWLYLFKDQLSEWALVSLLACVIGGFTILAFRRDVMQPMIGWKSNVLKVLFLIGILVALDLTFLPPGMLEIAMQLCLVLFLGLRLGGKI